MEVNNSLSLLSWFEILRFWVKLKLFLWLLTTCFTFCELPDNVLCPIFYQFMLIYKRSLNIVLYFCYLLQIRFFIFYFPFYLVFKYIDKKNCEDSKIVLVSQYCFGFQGLFIFPYECHMECRGVKHFHRQPHQPRGCLQRAECNFRTV